MKTTFLKISFIFLFLSLMGAGCEKEKKDDIWVQIDSLDENAQLGTQLDFIFSKDNACLLNFQKDTVFSAIFSHDAFGEIDNCNNIPVIDFENHTLIAGKIMVTSVSDSISSIRLISNSAKDRYKIEVSMDKCEECYWAIGYVYFWKLYPKLNLKYKIELLVTQK